MTGLPYIQTGAELGQAFAELGKGLGQIINPEGQFKKQFQEATLMHPELVQQLANAEYENPGSITSTYKKLLPKNIFNQITQTPPDASAIQRRGITDAIKGMNPDDAKKLWVARANGYNTVDEYDQAVAQGKVRNMTLDQIVGGGPVTLGTAGAVRSVTGESIGALEREPVETDLANLERTSRELNIPIERINSTMAARKLQYFNSLSPAEQRNVLFPELLADKHFQETEERLWAFFGARDEDRVKDTAARLNEAEADRMFNLFPTIAQPSDWLKYMTDPDTFSRARDLASGKIPVASDDDRKLVQMYHSGDQLEAGKRSMIQRQVQSAIVKNIHAIDGIGGPAATDATRPYYLSQLNQELRMLEQFGAPHMEATYQGKFKSLAHPFTSGVKLIDAAGQPVDPNLLANIPTDPSVADPNAVAAQLSHNANALAKWNAIVQSGNINAGLRQLGEYESQHGTPIQSGVWLQIMNAIHNTMPEGEVP